MSFKIIKDARIISAYSKLVSVLRTAAEYVVSLAWRMAGKNKSESGENRPASSDNNGDAGSNAANETDAADFSEAPEHWLMLLKNNNLSRFSFTGKAHQKRLLRVKSSIKNSADDNAKKTDSGLLEEPVNPVKITRPLLTNNSVANKSTGHHSRHNNHLTSENMQQENRKPFKFRHLFITNQDKKEGMQREAAFSAMDSGGQADYAKQRIHLKPALREQKDQDNSNKNIKKSTVYKKTTSPLAMDASVNPFQDKAAIASQTNLSNQTASRSQANQANIENTEHIRGAVRQTAIMTGFNRPDKEKQRNPTVPLLPSGDTSNAFKSDNKNADKRFTQTIITAAIQEQSYGQQARVNPDFISNDHKDAESFLARDKPPVYYWPELPDDAWQEESSANEFTVPLKIDTVNIREILWNG